MSSQIPDAALRASDVPTLFEEWSKLAATFDGYAEFGDRCAEIANARNPRTLSEYRACLFFEWRRWRHFGANPDDEARAYIWSLVEGIRSSLEKRNQA